ncbi:MAG: uroporphyrinogen decarboxylase family protein [Candidatus Thorarchaeota archaeon]|nr:MAG: uroporphyrinogen decarboxylase family protein [Candidatus Thorarchaeota archaeon]
MTEPTPLELIEDTLNGKETERVPVVPLVGLSSSTVSGFPVETLVRDSDKQAKSQLLAHNKFGYDGVFTCMDLTVEAQALGAEVVFDNQAFPYVKSHPVEDFERVEDLALPPVEETRISTFVDAARKLAEKLRETHLVSSYVIGPFTLAGHLLEAERLLEVSIEEQDLATEIVGHCERILHPVLDAYAEAGVHNIVILEPTASTSIISPRFFEKLSQPFMKNMIARVHTRGCRATVHICGRTQRIIDQMCQTGADALSLDSAVDVEAAIDIADGRTVIIGNVDTSLLLTGSTQDVKSAAEECLRASSGRAGFILSSGCDLPIETPHENVQVLVHTAKGGQ